ncbi:MAG TPA: DUF3341 domain-containing protein [Polyangia bacterium]|jgi:hypothetical protein|nr:DUF3341 domain-containing protein [Polyangia bacterium]
MSQGAHIPHEDTGFVPERYVLAKFATSDALLEATRKIREAGQGELDTHTPYPVHGLEKALGLGRPLIPTIVLGGAIAGAFIAYSMIYFMNVLDWPINIGNRPPHSPPANIPITFELAVLLAGSSSFFGFFTLARLPKPYHPVFQSESFRQASVDGFFLSIKIREGESPDAAAALAEAEGATHVEIIEELER